MHSQFDAKQGRLTVFCRPRHGRAHRQVRLVILALGLILLSSGARADTDLGAWIDGAKPLADVRLRYEGVSDAGKSAHADAFTLRARLGLQTGTWNGLAGLVEIDQLWDLDNDFNSTRNGKTAYPAVADPRMTTLNRLQLSYTSDFNATVVIGRQRIIFGDQRFVGNVGWRQHEQTYDAISVTNTSLPGLTATYAYVERVNRVFGPSAPVPAAGPAGALHCDCHLFDAVYSGTPGLKVEAFAFLLDLSQRSGPAAARLATAKLSTATFGMQASYHLRLTDEVSAQFLAAAAQQTNYRNNPLPIDLGYMRGEAGVSYRGLAATLGYEAMQGDGTTGFSTPLATLHAFDGWADLFLTTPANGIDDFYIKAAYAMPFVAHAIDLDSATVTLVHHDFSTDRTNLGIGSEWDAALEFSYDNASLLLKYAGYQGAGIGAGGFADKSVTWMQLAYKY